jgi:hypothetical protein
MGMHKHHNFYKYWRPGSGFLFLRESSHILLTSNIYSIAQGEFSNTRRNRHPGILEAASEIFSYTLQILEWFEKGPLEAPTTAAQSECRVTCCSPRSMHNCRPARIAIASVSSAV